MRTSRPVDLLRLLATSEVESYEDLLACTVEIRMADGLLLRVLDLPTLIASKERAARPKDVAMLPYLRATLDEIRRRG